MDNSKQEWLMKYLLNCGFVVPADQDLQNHITGMTSNDIIQAMEKAKKLMDNLNSTSLGRELN
jgi:hypothetical protein